MTKITGSPHQKKKTKDTRTYKNKTEKTKSNDDGDANQTALEKTDEGEALQEAHNSEVVQEPVLDWEFRYDNDEHVWYYKSYTGEMRVLLGWRRVYNPLC